MKRVALVFLLLLTSVYSLDTYKYQEALEKAQKENKYIIMILKTQYCPWCKRLINGVLPMPEIESKIDKEFVLTIIDRDKDKFPEKFYSRLVPTTFFIDPYAEDEVDMIIGYVNGQSFMSKLQNLKRPRD
jgi:hypothetical protein